MRKNLLTFFAVNFVIFYGLAAARAYNIPQKILMLLGGFLGTVGIVVACAAIIALELWMWPKSGKRK